MCSCRLLYQQLQKETQLKQRPAFISGAPVFTDIAPRKMRKLQVEGRGSIEEDKEIAPQVLTRSSLPGIDQVQ